MILDFLIFFVFIIAFFLLIIVLCALSGYLMHIRVVYICLEQALVSKEAP